MISDTPGRGGEGGGQKRANFCGRPLWMAPKLTLIDTGLLDTDRKKVVAQFFLLA